MIRKSIALFILLAGAIGIHAQSPYSTQIFGPTVMTATSQTSTPIPLGANGRSGSWAAGAITVTGTALTTATFSAIGSSDGGVTYYPIGMANYAVPGTITNTVTATANTLYLVSLVGLTHIKFITSGTFTATNISILLTAAPNGTASRGGGGGGGGGGSPTGPASGDLAGNYPGPTVFGFNGVPFCTGFTPTNNQVMQYTTASSPNPCWQAGTAAGGGIPYPSGSGAAIVSSGSAWGTTYPINGAGAGLATGPSTATSGDLAQYSGTAGQMSDSGVVAAAVLHAGAATSRKYFLSTTGTVAASTGSCGEDVSGNLSGCTSLSAGSTAVTACDSAAACLGWLGSATAGTPTSGQNYCITNASNTMVCSVNGGAETPVTFTIAAGTSSLGTSAIASGVCATAVTTTATGTASSDVLSWGFNGDPSGVVGYQAGTSGMLTILAYPTTNNVNYKVCNNTTASITPGAITLNWRVQR